MLEMRGLSGSMDKGLLSLVFVLYNIHLVTSDVLTSADEEEIVLSMNYFRSLVVPSAANMQPLVWSEELAAAALIDTQRCVLQSDPNGASNAPSFDTVGQNRVVTSTARMAPNYTRSIEVVWFNQRGDYDFTRNTCFSCDSYITLVWAATTSVGCASTICPRIQFFPIPNSIAFSCYFGPTGNIDDGMRPYESGIPCSNCLEEQDFCIDNLCSFCMDFSVNNGTRLVLYDEEGGANATYFCDDGFRPSRSVEQYSTTCNSTNGVWAPVPELTCTPITASVTLNEIDSGCPGDTITYNCSILSNSDILHLIWRVTFPEMSQPITMIYDNSSILNRTDTFTMNITTTRLTEFRSEEYISSTIVFKKERGVDLNGIELVCEIQGVIQGVESMSVNLSEPTSPTGFGYNIIKKESSISVFFTWAPQEMVSPEVTYKISIITNEDISTFNDIKTISWNVSLEYNVEYTVSINAMNCIGISNLTIISLLAVVNCGPPTPPFNGIIEYYSMTTEGDIVTFMCNSSTPTKVFTSVCSSDALWTPNPGDHICNATSLTDSQGKQMVISIVIPIVVILFVISAILSTVGGLTCYFNYSHKKVTRIIPVTPRHSL